MCCAWFYDLSLFLNNCLQLKHLRELLGECMFSVPLLSLPDSLQEEIIHWVFRNEDRSVSTSVSE